MIRLVVWLLSGMLLLAAALVVGAALALPWAAERLALGALRDAGMDKASVSVDAIGLERAVVSDLALGDGEVRVSHAVIAYDLRGLTRLEVARVELSGVALRSRWENGIRLPVLQGLERGPAGPGDRDIPFVDLNAVTLVVRDAEITIGGSPLGDVAVTGRGTVTREPDGRLLASVEARADGDSMTVSADVTATVAPETGTFSALVELYDGRYATGPVEVFGLGGTGTIASAPEGLPTVEARLTAAKVGLPIGTFDQAVADLSVGRDELAASVVLPTADAATRIEVTAEAAGWTGPAMTFALAANVAGLSPGDLPQTESDLLAYGEKPLSFTLTAEGTIEGPGTFAPAQPAAWLERARLEAALAFDLPEMTLTGIVERLTGHGDLTLAVADGTLTLDTAEGLSLTVRGFDPAAFDVSLPEPVAERVAGTVLFDLAPSPEPLLAVVPRGEARYETSLDQFLRIGTADGVVLAAALRARGVVDPEAQTIEDFTAERLALSLSGYEDRVFGLRLQELRLAVSGDREALTGDWTLRAAGDLELDAARFRETAIDFAGGIALSRERLRLQFGEDSRLTSAGGRIADVIDLEPLRLTPVTGGDPLLEVSFAGREPFGFRSHLAFAPITLAGTVTAAADDGQAMTVDATIPDLAFDVSGERRAEAGDLAYTATVVVRDAGLRAPGINVAADGIAIDAETTGEGLAATARVAALRHTAVPPVIAPLEVTLDSTVAAGTVALDVRVSDKTGALIVDFEGRHRLGPGEGEGDLTLHPVRFATEGGLQPATLFPITKRHLAATDGLVRATGTVNWSPEDVGGEIEIIIEDFATVAGEVAIEGVQGVILIDDVWPPSTPPEQVIAVGAVTAGLPLTNGVIIGRLGSDGLPVIRETQWKWAGGTVSSSPIRVTKEGDIEDFALTLDNIDFGALLELTPEAENIDATGTLSGRIPMGFRGGAFQVVEGRLTTTGPGTLRYTPEALSEDFVETNPGLGLFLQAVENFAYDQIVIELDGKTGDEVDIALHIDGKNPDLYGGTPFELNVTITGRLDEIFRQSLDTMRIQELLRKQIREQEP